ncbi:magnesium chelatase accessory protein [Roseovarius nanhaiticus]|uniref:Magnesium chelatase accessory protein n=1 Tax=Roseovarius nanhaiticus TaxID=573024 RepID=A0A1N7HG75_9RHOB|nr:alpha/beta fold hydrolase BchO [Roseovarius nanhaiticus]SEK96250.1 magnesium chelatase accessory protein [Roseovarius nanhaiticus]SIS23897.1 magnesium chelatase accessory protein [Roseovarius nanhaiticus]
MRWPQDSEGWPITAQSRMILHRPHRWHVQEMGDGPTLILLHGAGGATHSWRGLMPILAHSFHVIALDLPGQGFTQSGARQRSGLEGMSADIAELIAAEGWLPAALIGHSAGGAIALDLALRIARPDMRIVTLNAALSNFSGVAGWLFPRLAKLLAMTPFTADLFAATASSTASVTRLIEGTGSKLPPEGIALYQRLVSDRAHVDATLAMMSQWSLEDLLAQLGRIENRTLMLTGARDRAVPPEVSERAAARMPHAQVRKMPGLGHLMHEEAPEDVAEVITAFLAE